jgi:hypothetical protein
MYFLGLCQGCSLSPVCVWNVYKWIPVIVTKRLYKRNSVIYDILNFLLLFANDIVLISDTVTVLQMQLNSLHQYVHGVN